MKRAKASGEVERISARDLGKAAPPTCWPGLTGALRPRSFFQLARFPRQGSRDERPFVLVKPAPFDLRGPFCGRPLWVSLLSFCGRPGRDPVRPFERSAGRGPPPEAPTGTFAFAAAAATTGARAAAS